MFLRFLLKLLLVFAKIVIITLVFEKNDIFFAENWQKSQKIVIITSTPDLAYFWDTYCLVGVYMYVAHILCCFLFAEKLKYYT
jgi:hypothetical protein